MQAGYMIKKLAEGFAAGIQKIFVSSDVNFDAYYIPNWRYAGMITSSGQKKPAYFNLKLLIEMVDGYEQVQKLDGYLYEFTFSDKNNVYLYWEDAVSSTSLTALGDYPNTIYEFVYTYRESTRSVEVLAIEEYDFSPNPVFITRR